jgi:hypothetical protein
MASARAARGGSGGATATVAADHHAHGYLAMSPLMLLGMFGVCAVAYWLFSQLQISATEQTVFNMLSSGIQVTPGMTGDQVKEFMQGQLGHDQTIAYGIGWSVQVALTLVSFPPTSALLMLHRRFNNDPGTSLTEAATRYAKWQKFMSWALIGGDVLTDFLYVVENHMSIQWDGLWPNIQGFSWGIILVGIIYPTGICFVTIFVGKYMFVFLDALIDKLKKAA